MEQLKGGLLISELRMLEYQAIIEHLIKGIDSGNMSAETLERAREVAEIAP